MLFPLLAVAFLAYLLLRPTLLRPRVRRWRVPRPSKAAADKAVAVGIVVAALAVLVHGNVWAAFCLFGLSLWVLGRATRPARLPPRRSATVELTVDPASGRRGARMVAGPHRGTDLDSLALAQCLRLLAATRATDPAGASLLEAYLDGRAPLWRAAGEADGHAAPGRTRATGGMTEEQAYQVLGLGRGAPREAVVRAHRTLMKRWHPDGGGTAELAARANEAKEVLLRQHG